MPWQLELIHMCFTPQGVFTLALLVRVSTQIGRSVIIQWSCGYNNSQCSCKITKTLWVQFLFRFLSKTPINLIGDCWLLVIMLLLLLSLMRDGWVLFVIRYSANTSPACLKDHQWSELYHPFPQKRPQSRYLIAPPLHFLITLGQSFVNTTPPPSDIQSPPSFVPLVK